MADTILMFVGTFMILASIAYACWAKARVILLREALFAIRDDLWDAAYELDAMDDAAHQTTRKHLNACINAADWVSVGTIQMAISARSENAVKVESDNKELVSAINQAYARTAFTIATYALFHRLSGWLFILLTGTKFVVERMTETWVRSQAPEYLNKMESRPIHGHA